MNEIINNEKDTSGLIIFYQFVIYVAMISGYKGIAYTIAFLFVALFAAKIFTKDRRLPKNKSWSSFVLFLVFYWITSLFNFHSTNFYIYLIYYTICFFPIVITEYLKKSSTTEIIIKSLKCFMFVFIVFCLISIGFYLANPRLARDMASHAVEGKLAIGGGYFLAYAASIICVYIFSKMLNGRIERKISYIFICIVCFVLVYLTESALTFISMLVGIVISVITMGRETSKAVAWSFVKFVFIGLLVVIATYIIMYNRYTIADWILDFTADKDGNIVYSRIEEIVNKLVYGRTNGHVDKRSGTLESSIEIFKQYPIFGMGYTYGNVFAWGKMYGMGNHSEILDSFARYGIVGGCLWLFPYFRALKQIFAKNFGCAITILMMMFFNPFLSFHSNTVLFLFHSAA